ncbi:MAG TPA: hypothetical protein VMU76_09240 [Acidimicrobiales bacterium]|nr:hypothetical protein [Acidimicrobiales bacterium]
MRAERTVEAKSLQVESADAVPGQGVSLAICRSCRRRMRGNPALLQAVVKTKGRVSRSP